jgi:ABC-2 type transport system ATP-binding protein
VPEGATRGDGPMKDSVIDMRDTSKWFGEVVAVNRLNINVKPGVTGLLGPNGAGKTTLLRLVLGLYEPSRGSVRVFGEDPRNNLSVLRRVGYCPELDRFFENMSGRAFVRWLCRYQGMGRNAADRAAQEACAQVGMARRMDDRIETYSQGMRQRIRIAQAIAHDPELLILDEPMSGLDPEAREEIFRLVLRLGQSGRTVIVSSHVLYEIERVTNNIILMHSGRILAQGTVREIRELIDEHPHTVRVQCGEPRIVAERFATEASTLGMDVGDSTVFIRTADPGRFYETLNELIIEHDVAVESLDCPDDNLQSVFDYLVK